MLRGVPSSWRGAGGALASVLAVAACSSNPYDGRADVAAEAGGATLTPAAVTTWVSRVPGRAPTKIDAGFVALTWVDYTLLAKAASAGTGLLDSATAFAALMPERTLVPLRKWHDTLVARRPRVAADVPDTLYEEGVRVFQEIFLRVADPDDVRAITALRQNADSLVVLARAPGADFAALARVHSQDGAAAGGGWLAPGRRGGFPPEFERSAWRIAPGEISGALSRGGFHIVRRPPLAEVRDRLRVYAESLATRKADSVYADSLQLARGLTLGVNVAGRIRSFFADPSVRDKDTAALARWVDGELTLDEASAWIDMLPARAYLDLRGTSDVILERFTRELGQQKLMLSDAQKQGISLTPAEWATLHEGYRRALGASLMLLGADSGSTTIPAGEADARVKALLDRLTTDSTRYRPLPSALAAVLRSRSGYRLHDKGLEAAVAAAVQP
ncbi:MAG TPA: peptidylprolyl isomerase [Gemmatimonadales bacterium]|nr:peptidylprolyl isomerase [Gemmatimonadales bacterium]